MLRDGAMVGGYLGGPEEAAETLHTRDRRPPVDHRRAAAGAMSVAVIGVGAIGGLVPPSSWPRART